jgi:hypothetical protein
LDLEAKHNHLSGQDVQTQLRHPQSLSEVGAWRLARQLVAQGDGLGAARLWTQRPFNPDWGALPFGERVRWPKAGVPFVQWLGDYAKTALDPLMAKYLDQAQGLARGSQELLHLGADLREHEDNKTPPRSLPKPRL